jgi:hypothetical protein
MQTLLEVSPFEDKVFIFMEDVLEGDEVVVNPLDLIFS